jgi:hypothetical protein
MFYAMNKYPSAILADLTTHKNIIVVKYKGERFGELDFEAYFCTLLKNKISFKISHPVRSVNLFGIFYL